MCHWQTCYAYQCMVEKLSGDRVVDLTVKVLDLNALMENKTPNVSYLILTISSLRKNTPQVCLT